MFAADRSSDAVPVTLLTPDTFSAWSETADEDTRSWLALQGFRAQPGRVCMMPPERGVSRLLVGMETDAWLYALAPVAQTLHGGSCYIDATLDARAAHLSALGFALAQYQFLRYGKPRRDFGTLVLPAGAEPEQVEADAAAVTLARDLINTAPEDMMPPALEQAARDLAERFDASIDVTTGDDLLTANYPAIHAVGRASVHAPRLIDLRWGPEDAPRVTLIGKGVCFDSGGLDIKPASGMRLMKKDMGGAAHALGLAQRIMAARLNVQLRVLVPAVENAISGNAFHPGDVLDTRAGKTVEIDNTDAEGRLILCDALSEASSENPAQILDFATLTGAARVALGTELPAMFANDDELATGLQSSGDAVADPLWRLPLHKPYRKMLESRIAHTLNSSPTPFGGAITAALFLELFVGASVPWAHFDIMAWNRSSQPGRPEGGEAMGLRACFEQIQRRFGD